MDSYTWLKSLHIISVIAWMAGLFYLPRLFVYHTQKENGSDASETFKIMERKLLCIIMHPAMIASVVTGFILILMFFIDDLSSAGWLHTKILFLVAMIIFHFTLARWQKAFANDENTHSEKFYRFMNEVPTMLMIAIVILAVGKPF